MTPTPADLAAFGFHVFPLLPGSKRPACSGWTDPAARFDFEDGQNVGIFTGAFGAGGGALLVVDVDNKGDKHGDETILQLEMAGCALPPTLEARTPTGGRHLYYLVPRAVRSTVEAIGPGIDTRSAGGYVVAPPSRLYSLADGDRTELGVYAFTEFPRPLANAPAWLVEKCGAPRERSVEPVAPLTGYAAEVAYAKAMRYLQEEAPEAVEGAGGDFTTYKVAARVRDFGVTESECLALMQEHWHEGCGWNPTDLASKVRNAYAYATGTFGGDNPATLFEPVAGSLAVNPSDEGTTARYRLESVSDVLARPPPRWLVRGILPERGMAVMYGAPGSGKTFSALDLAAAIARGTPWAGRRVRATPVVYVGLEGHMGTRLRAYTLDRQPGDTLGGFWIVERQPLDLLNPADAKALANDIASVSPGLVVIDTLNRSIPGGDENSSEDMGKAIYAAAHLTARLDCLVLFVHHSGKSEAAGARGHSSLLGAADAELSVSRNEDGERFIETTKVKDGDDDARFAFKLRVVDLGAARDHDPDADADERVTSCVVDDLRPVAGSAAAPRVKLGVHEGNGLRAFKATMQFYALEHDRPFDDDSVLLEHWRDRFLHDYEGDPRAAKHFYDARAGLRRKGLVTDGENGRIALTDAGRIA